MSCNEMASTNIKLKILEDKLKDTLVPKDLTEFDTLKTLPKEALMYAYSEGKPYKLNADLVAGGIPVDPFINVTELPYPYVAKPIGTSGFVEKLYLNTTFIEQHTEEAFNFLKSIKKVSIPDEEFSLYLIALFGFAPQQDLLTVIEPDKNSVAIIFAASELPLVSIVKTDTGYSYEYGSDVINGAFTVNIEINNDSFNSDLEYITNLVAVEGKLPIGSLNTDLSKIIALSNNFGINTEIDKKAIYRLNEKNKVINKPIPSTGSNEEITKIYFNNTLKDEEILSILKRVYYEPASGNPDEIFSDADFASPFSDGAFTSDLWMLRSPNDGSIGFTFVIDETLNNGIAAIGLTYNAETKEITKQGFELTELNFALGTLNKSGETAEVNKHNLEVLSKLFSIEPFKFDTKPTYEYSYWQFKNEAWHKIILDDTLDDIISQIPQSKALVISLPAGGIFPQPDPDGYVTFNFDSSQSRKLLAMDYGELANVYYTDNDGYLILSMQLMCYSRSVRGVTEKAFSVVNYNITGFTNMLEACNSSLDASNNVVIKIKPYAIFPSQLVTLERLEQYLPEINSGAPSTDKMETLTLGEDTFSVSSKSVLTIHPNLTSETDFTISQEEYNELQLDQYTLIKADLTQTPFGIVIYGVKELLKDNILQIRAVWGRNPSNREFMILYLQIKPDLSGTLIGFDFSIRCKNSTDEFIPTVEATRDIIKNEIPTIFNFSNTSSQTSAKELKEITLSLPTGQEVWKVNGVSETQVQDMINTSIMGAITKEY